MRFKAHHYDTVIPLIQSLDILFLYIHHTWVLPSAQVNGRHQISFFCKDTTMQYLKRMSVTEITLAALYCRKIQVRCHGYQKYNT